MGQSSWLLSRLQRRAERKLLQCPLLEFRMLALDSRFFRSEAVLRIQPLTSRDHLRTCVTM
jgi:hypothetical protein